jgi:hypothetical protein
VITVNGRKQKRLETAMRKPPGNAMVPEAEPKHIGGGWYLLSGGEKIRGREEAIIAQRGLR